MNIFMKPKRFLYILIALLFITSFFSLCNAKPAKEKAGKKDKAPVTDYVVASEDKKEASSEEPEVILSLNEENEDENSSNNNDNEDEENENDEEEDEEILNQKADKLLEKIDELENDSDILALLTKPENDTVVSNNTSLLRTLVGIYLKDPKKNERFLKNYGSKLRELDNNSKEGNYAVGLTLMKAKKPNYKKAMECFAICKKGKKPFKDSASLYTQCFLKVYLLYIIIGIIAAIILIAVIVIAIIKKKKNKATPDESVTETTETDNQIDLQKLIDEPSSTQAEAVQSNNQDNEINNAAVSGESANNNNETNVSINTPQPTPSVETPVNENTLSSANIVAPSEKIVPKQEPIIATAPQIMQQPQVMKKEEVKVYNEPSPNININTPPVIMEQDYSTNESKIQDNTIYQTDNSTDLQSSSIPTKKIVRVVKKVRVRKDADGNSYVVSEETTPQQIVSEEPYDYNQQEKVDLDSVRNIVRPAEKPIQPIDPELDAIWERLSKKAINGHIQQLVRTDEEVSNTYGQHSETIKNNKEDTNKTIIQLDENLNIIDNKKEPEPELNFDDVTIDLSEDALKEDLVGKLKMLAITDSELQELFEMKNPSHIPYLIEYIMTKPEPARLAFIAKGLGSYADPAVVDVLSSLLYHEDERVVVGAIHGLEATELPSAVIPLCPFLRSEVPLFAKEAREALNKFGPAKIMLALKELPSFGDPKLKEAGIFVLSRMKGEAVETILKEMLRDKSSDIRIQVILAMSYQKNPVFIESLREFYRTANDTEKSMTRKAIVYLNEFNK